MIAFNYFLFFVITIATVASCNSKESHRQTNPPMTSPNPTNASIEGGGSTDIGSGGDGMKARWYSVASMLNTNLRKLVHVSIDQSVFQKIQKDFDKVVSNSRVEFKEYPLVLGIEKSDKDNPALLSFSTPFSCESQIENHEDKERHAINFKSKNLIKVNTHRINCYDPFGKDLQRLVLHEYLGLMGIYENDESSIDYEITNLLIKDMETLVQFEFDSGLDVISISTCDDLQNKVGLKEELPLFPYAGSASKEVRSVSDFHYNPKNIYRVTNDIDCSESIKWNEGKGFSPIYLDGHFDGNGYSITSLHIGDSKEKEKIEGGALFQKTCIRCQIAHLKIKGIKGFGSALLVSVHSGGIRHVDLEGHLTKIGASNYFEPYSNKKGWQEPAGGLVGVNSGGNIRYSRVAVEIESTQPSFENGVTANVHGCVVGLNLAGLVASTNTDCKIIGNGVLGGIVGYNQWGVVKDTFSDIQIQGGVVTAIGGTAGINEGAIYNCQATGTISLVGTHWPMDQYPFERTSIGGLIGLNIDNNWEFGEHSLGRVDLSRTDVDICGAYAPIQTSVGIYQSEIDPLIGSYDGLKGVSMSGEKFYQKDFGKNHNLQDSTGTGQISPSCN